MEAALYLLRHFIRRHGRETAISTLLYGGVVVSCFWAGALLSVEIRNTQDFTLSSLCFAHVVRANFFGASEFCLSPPQRLLMLTALLSIILLLVLYAREHVASSDPYTMVFMPLLLASLASVYVDFIFAGVIKKMLPRS
jgi:hypothetical protein